LINPDIIEAFTTKKGSNNDSIRSLLQQKGHRQELMANPLKTKSRLAITLSRYVILMAFIIGIALSSAQVIYDFTSQDEELDATIQEIQKSSLPSAIRSVTTLDKSLANEIVVGLLKYEFIESAEITDELGITLSKSSKHISKTKTSWLTGLIGGTRKTYIENLSNPIYSNIPPGKLTIVINVDKFLETFYNRSSFVIISGVLRNIALSIALLLIFFSLITKPLENLAKTFKSIDINSNKELSVSKRHQHNELGALSDAGNYFLSRVNELISEKTKTQKRMTYLATHDDTTGLPNRYLFKQHLSKAMDSSDNESNAILFLDLDHFKNINDSQGHETGDAVLIEISKILARKISSTDLLARFGGDEFVILMESKETNREQAQKSANDLAQDIIKTLTQIIQTEGKIFHIGVSIGIVMFPLENTNEELLLRFADTAMYEAKNRGRKRAVVYQREMSTSVENKHQLEMHLHAAITSNQLEVFYQPQVDLTGKITGFEALLRWNHPERGLVSPLEFIPIMESNGLIIPVSEWLVNDVCEQITRWKVQHQWQTHWSVSINISTVHFYHQDFLSLFTSVLNRHRILPQELCIEITESIAIDNIAFSIERLNDIKKIGISISLDDFGTGYSSFSYLKNLPINTIKIDRSFIKELELREDDKAILTAINALAHSLRLNVIAEGVENIEQVNIAIQCGCSTFQGFYYHRPMTAGKLTELINNTC